MISHPHHRLSLRQGRPKPKGKNGNRNRTSPIQDKLVWLIPPERRHREERSQECSRQKRHGQDGNGFHGRAVLAGGFGEGFTGVGDLDVDF